MGKVGMERGVGVVFIFIESFGMSLAFGRMTKYRCHIQGTLRQGWLSLIVKGGS